MKYLRIFENFFDLSKNKKLNKEEFEQLLKEKCSDFKWSDRPIYRSISSTEPYLYINSNIHKNGYKKDGFFYRKSMQSGYGNNYLHTPLMNHLNSWSEYPKRQLICSTSMRIFKGYENSLYRVIPFNGSKWGIVPHFDLHNVRLNNAFSKSLSDLMNNIMGNHFHLKIETFSDLINVRFPKFEDIYGDDCFIPAKDEYSASIYLSSAAAGKSISIENWNDILKFCRLVDISGDSWIFSKKPKTPLNIDILNSLFSPESMNFKNMSYSEYIKSSGSLPKYTYQDGIGVDSPKIYENKPDPGHEIWTDSNVLLVKVKD